MEGPAAQGAQGATPLQQDRFLFMAALPPLRGDPALHAPGAYCFPTAMEPRMLGGLWDDIERVIRDELLASVTERHALCELVQLFMWRYADPRLSDTARAQARQRCADWFLGRLRFVNLCQVIKDVRAEFARSIEQRLAQVSLEPVMVNICAFYFDRSGSGGGTATMLLTPSTPDMDADVLGHPGCYAESAGGHVLQFNDFLSESQQQLAGRVTLENADGRTAYSLALFMWTVCHLLLKRLTLIGRFCETCGEELTAFTVRKIWQQVDGYEQELSKAVHRKAEGNRLFRERKYEEALAQYCEAISSSPPGDDNRPAYHCNRALCCLHLASDAATDPQAKQQHLQRTVADCSWVLEVHPRNVKALYRRAQAHELSGRYHAALEDLSALLAEAPTNSEARLMLARLLRRDEAEQAVVLLEQGWEAEHAAERGRLQQKRARQRKPSGGAEEAEEPPSQPLTLAELIARDPSRAARELTEAEQRIAAARRRSERARQEQHVREEEAARQRQEERERKERERRERREREREERERKERERREKEARQAEEQEWRRLQREQQLREQEKEERRRKEEEGKRLREEREREETRRREQRERERLRKEREKEEQRQRDREQKERERAERRRREEEERREEELRRRREQEQWAAELAAAAAAAERETRKRNRQQQGRAEQPRAARSRSDRPHEAPPQQQPRQRQPPQQPRNARRSQGVKCTDVSPPSASGQQRGAAAAPEADAHGGVRRGGSPRRGGAADESPCRGTPGSPGSSCDDGWHDWHAAADAGSGAGAQGSSLFEQSPFFAPFRTAQGQTAAYTPLGAFAPSAAPPDSAGSLFSHEASAPPYAHRRGPCGGAAEAAAASGGDSADYCGEELPFAAPPVTLPCNVASLPGTAAAAAAIASTTRRRCPEDAAAGGPGDRSLFGSSSLFSSSPSGCDGGLFGTGSGFDAPDGPSESSSAALIGEGLSQFLRAMGAGGDPAAT